jgi:hypothetical protein
MSLPILSARMVEDSLAYRTKILCMYLHMRARYVDQLCTL